MTPAPGMGDMLSGAIMGFWAFLGAVMRGGNDWKEPVSGNFSIGRFLASVATALVLGQMASALGQSQHWEPYIISAMASMLGYLGPAVAMQFFQKRFLGDSDASSAASPAKD